MNKITIIIAGVFILLSALLFILTIIIKNKRKNNILSSVDKLTTEKNLIISSQLMSELSKASKLVNNKKTEELVESWKKRFNNIENKDMPKLTDNLIEVENLCVNKEYKAAKEALSLAEKNILNVKAK